MTRQSSKSAHRANTVLNSVTVTEPPGLLQFRGDGLDDGFGVGCHGRGGQRVGLLSSLDTDDLDDRDEGRDDRGDDSRPDVADAADLGSAESTDERLYGGRADAVSEVDKSFLHGVPPLGARVGWCTVIRIRSGTGVHNPEFVPPGPCLWWLPVGSGGACGSLCTGSALSACGACRTGAIVVRGTVGVHRCADLRVGGVLAGRSLSPIGAWATRLTGSALVSSRAASARWPLAR